MSSRRISPNANEQKVNIVGGSQFGRYPKISVEKTYNMFITIAGNPDGDDFEAWLVNFAGYSRNTNIINAGSVPPGTLPSNWPTGNGRGLFKSTRGGFAIVVVNANVYRLDLATTAGQTFAPTFVGTLNTTSGEVFIAENLSEQICVVDGADAWIYYYGVGGPSFTKQTDPYFGGSLIPNYVEYHNSFFLFGNANTSSTGSQWYIYGTALQASLGNITILGTGVLAATELLINGKDVAGTYISVAAFVNYINTGAVSGVTAISTGSAVTLLSTNAIILKTAGTVGANGITFANFSTTGGALTETFSTVSNTSIAYVTSLALQTKADFAIAVKRLPGQGNNVMVFGESVAEIWTQVGGAQEYIRNPTRNINYGCISVRTIGESGNTVAWLGVNEEESPVIMTYDGTNLNAISTDGIDYLLGQINVPASSTALFYRLDGHLFYQLTFYDVSDNLTLIYDFNTKQFFHLTDQFGNYHPARQLMYFNNSIYFVSLNNAAIYELSTNIKTIDENLPLTSSASPYDANLVYQIPRERITSSIREANSTRFIANSLVVTLEQGDDPTIQAVTIIDQLITEDGANPPDDPIITENGAAMLDEDSVATPYYNPRIDLAISKDGGYTWSNTVGRELHTLGNRQNILQWEGMGAANDLCFRFRFWGEYRFVVNNGLVSIIS